MPCPSSTTPMLGCCGGSSPGQLGQFQIIEVTKIIPNTSSPEGWKFTDVDSWFGEIDGVLASTPFPGVWSSRTTIIIDRDGNSTTFLNNAGNATLPSLLVDVAGFRIFFSGPVTPPPRGTEQLFQNFGGSSRITVTKGLYILRGPWASTLSASAGQPFGTINECVFNPGTDIFEVEAAGGGQTSFTLPLTWGADGVVSGVRNRRVFATPVSPC